MSLAHLTLPRRDVEKTASFLEKTFGYVREPVNGYVFEVIDQDRSGQLETR